MFIALYNQVKDLIQRQPSKETTNDYIPYGSGDSYPLKTAKAIQDSITANACLDTLTKFIRGAEFSEADLNLKIVNKTGETFFDFHKKVSESFAQFRGFAICVKYNLEGKISAFYSIPFESCRLGKPDDTGQISKIYYNPLYGTETPFFRSKEGVVYAQSESGDKKYTECYDTFNPDPAIVNAQVVKSTKKGQKSTFKGQILYYGETSPLSRFYPFPKYNSAVNWMIIEAKIGEFHVKNLDNGFFQSVLMRFVGDPNQESTHPDDQSWDETNSVYKSTRTVGERMNIEMQKFSGSSKVGNVMVQWGQNKDEFPDIQAFPTNANNELFTSLTTGAVEKIALGFNVLPVLANIQSGASLGGDGNLLRTSIKVMQSRTADDQKTLEETYSKLLTNFYEPYTGEISIVDYNPFPEMGAVDKTIWDSLTTVEKRTWIKENTDFPIIDVTAVPETPKPAAPPVPKAMNALWSDYPEGAKKNAATALSYRENKGECMTKMGWDRTEMIAKGMPMTYKDVKKIYNYLNKISWAKDRLINESCESLQHMGWGGVDMFDWAGAKIKSIEL